MLRQAYIRRRKGQSRDEFALAPAIRQLSLITFCETLRPPIGSYYEKMSEQDIPIISVDATATPPTVTIGMGGSRHTISTTAEICEKARALLAQRGHAVARVRYPSEGGREIVGVA